MPRLSAIQNEARERISRHARQALPPGVLGEAIMAALCMAIPCDIHTLYAVDPDSLLFTRVLAGSGGAGEGGSRLRWLRHTYLVRQPGLCNPPGMMHLGLPAVALHEDLRRCVGAAPALVGTESPLAWWHHFHEVEGVPFRNVLPAFCAADGRWVASLTLVRVDPDAAYFKPADVAFLRIVAPVIGRAVRAALVRERAEGAQGDGPDTSSRAAIGLIVLGRDGRVQTHNPAADGWIALQETWMPHAPGIPQLPTAVWTALAALRAAPEEHAASVLHVPSARGMVRIEASWGTAGETAMVALAPVAPPAPPGLPDDWPLTPGERRVLACVAHGLTNRQIAAQLTVSERTVVSHLEHAYEKLGLHSRTQLLARLFREVHLPGMMD